MTLPLKLVTGILAFLFAAFGIHFSAHAEEYADEVESFESLTFMDRLSMDYFAIFYGPSLGHPSLYQPRPNGEPDLDRPLLMKNFAAVRFDVSDAITIAPTAYWLVRPVSGQGFQLMDPFLQVSHNRLYERGNFYVYGDVRVHPGVSPISRQNDQILGLQLFQMAGLNLNRLTLGVYNSLRANFFGSQGFGNDVELYVGPNLNYQITPDLAFTLLYEIQVNHGVGSSFNTFYREGIGLEPGLNWNITPTLWINPYLTLYPHDKLSLESTAFGMMLSWQLLS